MQQNPISVAWNHQCQREEPRAASLQLKVTCITRPLLQSLLGDHLTRATPVHAMFGPRFWQHFCFASPERELDL